MSKMVEGSWVGGGETGHLGLSGHPVRRALEISISLFFPGGGTIIIPFHDEDTGSPENL